MGMSKKDKIISEIEIAAKAWNHKHGVNKFSLFNTDNLYGFIYGYIKQAQDITKAEEIETAFLANLHAYSGDNYCPSNNKSLKWIAFDLFQTIYNLANRERNIFNTVNYMYERDRVVYDLKIRSQRLRELEELPITNLTLELFKKEIRDAFLNLRNITDLPYGGNGKYYSAELFEILNKRNYYGEYFYKFDLESHIAGDPNFLSIDDICQILCQTANREVFLGAINSLANKIFKELYFPMRSFSCASIQAYDGALGQGGEKNYILESIRCLLYLGRLTILDNVHKITDKDVKGIFSSELLKAYGNGPSLERDDIMKWSTFRFIEGGIEYWYSNHKVDPIYIRPQLIEHEFVDDPRPRNRARLDTATRDAINTAFYTTLETVVEEMNSNANLSELYNKSIVTSIHAELDDSIKRFIIGFGEL